jgi:predicted urease superfamily metal-dependent hydrolase
VSYETLKEAMDKLEAQTKMLRDALEAAQEEGPPLLFKPTFLVDKHDRDEMERIREQLGLRNNGEVLAFAFDKLLELERRIANSTEEQVTLFMDDLLSDPMLK